MRGHYIVLAENPRLPPEKKAPIYVPEELVFTKKTPRKNGDAPAGHRAKQRKRR
jgi:hypothetical protein